MTHAPSGTRPIEEDSEEDLYRSVQDAMHEGFSGTANSGHSQTENDDEARIAERTQHFLNCYMGTYIAKLCQENNIDCDRYSTKEARVAVLAKIPPEELRAPEDEVMKAAAEAASQRRKERRARREAAMREREEQLRLEALQREALQQEAIQNREEREEAEVRAEDHGVRPREIGPAVLSQRGYRTSDSSSDESGSRRSRRHEDRDSILRGFMEQQQAMVQLLQSQQEMMRQQMQTLSETARSTSSTPSLQRGLRKIHGLSKLSRDNDILCYLETFEVLMETNSIDRTEWYLYLCSMLTGRAEAAFYSLAAEDRKDYDIVHQAIMDQYGCTHEIYRKKFLEARRREKQSYVDHASRLKTFFKRWMGEGASVEEVTTKVMVNQFISAIEDKALQRELRKDSKGKSLREVAQLADELETMGHRGSRDQPARYQAKPWFKDKFRGRPQMQQPQEQVSQQRNFGSTTSGSIESMYGQRKPDGRSCYKCGKPNHVAKDCTVKPKGSMQQPWSRKVNKIAVAGSRKDQPKGESSKQTTSRDSSGGPVKKVSRVQAAEPPVERIVRLDGSAPGRLSGDTEPSPTGGQVKRSEHAEQKRLCYVAACIRGHELTCLLDTGSEVNVMPVHIADKLDIRKDQMGNGTKTTLLNADGSTRPTMGTFCLSASINGLTRDIEVHIVEVSTDELILGEPALVAFGISINCGARTYTLGPQPEIQIPWQGTAGQASSSEVIRWPEPMLADIGGDSAVDVEEPIALPPISQWELEQLRESYKHVISDVPGRTDVVKHTGVLTTTRDIRSRIIPMSTERRRAYDAYIQEMLELGIVEESKSRHRSTAIVLRKPVKPEEPLTKRWRIVVDYREINKYTMPDAYPIPNAEEIFAELRGKKVFSCLDMKLGYHQMVISDEFREATAFSGPGGKLYQYVTLPLGLVNSPASFARLMEVVLGPLLRKIVWIYMDDILIASDTLEEHFEHLRLVLDLLAASGLTVSREKMKLCYTKLRFLGRIVSADGVSMDPRKMEAIRNYPVPKDRKGIERFMGVVSWNHQFIKDLATIAAPLNALRKKEAKWRWSEECQVAFDTLKDLLCSSPVLAYPQRGQPFTLFVDASDFGLGAILCQEQEGKLRVIEYASKSLQGAEKSYPTSEKECLAIVWALEKWRSYVEGVETTVVTDHQALTHLFSSAKSRGRLARWGLRVQDFRVNVKYRPGKEHAAPDALSRIMTLDQQTVSVVKEVLDEKCAADICHPASRSVEKILWISCDLCELWFHQRCVGVTAKEASEMETFACPTCRRRQTMDNGNLPTTTQLTKETLFKAQREQQDLKSIIEEMSEARNKTKKIGDRAYEIHGQLLYVRKDGHLRLVIPQTLVSDVLRLNHDLPTSGHRGVKATFERVARSSWWHSVRGDVKAYVSSCDICQKTKSRNTMKYGTMQTVTSTKVWELVAMDLVGPLPKSATGHRQALVVQDHYSRWILVLPLKVASANEVCRAVEQHVFGQYGAPTRLLTDNGTQFVSRKFREMCDKWNTKQVQTSIYHPQANFVERTNKDLKQALRAFVGKDHTSWPDQASAFQYTHNSNKSEATGRSPSDIFLHRTLVGPETLPFKPEGDMRSPEEAVPVDNTKKTERNKTSYDQHRRPHSFKVGEMVLVQTHYRSRASENFSSKLAPIWHGPWLITAQKGPNTFEVEVGRKRKTIHVEQMKKYVARE